MSGKEHQQELRDLDMPGKDAVQITGGQKKPANRAAVSDLVVTKRVDRASS